MRNLLTEQRYVAITLMLFAGAAMQVGALRLRGAWLGSRLELLIVLALLGALAIVALSLTWGLGAHSRPREWIVSLSARLGRLAWIFWVASLALFPLVVLGPVGRFAESLLVRSALLWTLGVTAASLLVGVWESGSWEQRLAGSLLAGACLYLIGTYVPGVSSYPLALGWSETSRYYYASLFLSEQIYGITVPPSVLHPSRYLLQAMPFLIPESTLWMHRLWQTALWLGLPALTALALVRRLRLAHPWTGWLAGLAAFLFLFQGPVLYHLLVGVILVLLGFDSRHFGRSLLIVIAASLWSGVSRLNWIPVPGLLAASLYLLESPRGEVSTVRYWLRPAGMALIGSLVALAAHSGYIVLSGNAAEQFGSSFTSDLLWYRLLPNPTFPPGVVLAVALVSAPVAAVIWRAATAQAKMDQARWLPIAAALGVLLLGGVVVSVKIGGGSNLHNLDAYLILLLVVGAYLYFGRLAEVDAQPAGQTGGATVLLLAIPMLFALLGGGPAPDLDHAHAQRVVAEVQSNIDQLAEPNPTILFISERHLVTFGIVQGVALSPDYEKVFLMEMAMSGTRSYLDAFHHRLETQQFDLIVSDPLKIQFQGRTRAFGEENDAWVREVSEPALCYYEPVLTLEEAEVQILRPRSEIGDCARTTDPA